MVQKMNKKSLIKKIIFELEENLSILTQSAKAAYEGATHKESISDDKYDTRGLEASYLAAGQSERIDELTQMINRYHSLKIREFDEETPIALTAVIELQNEGNRSLYFLGPFGGGMEIPFEGETLFLITPQSPLGRKLLEKYEGDTVELDLKGNQKEYEVLSVL